nr:MAG TPA: hypothetical protein [Caudoviricetes sp.]
MKHMKYIDFLELIAFLFILENMGLIMLACFL